MNYKIIYERLVLKAKEENRNRTSEIYYENHHIIPRCLKGNEEKQNKVLLTAREHFIAHKLLTYIYPENIKLMHAFHMMASINRGDIKISSKDYEYAKELKSLAMILNNPSKNKEVAKKIGDGNRGKTVSKESRIKMADSKMGHIVSTETIIKTNRTKKENGVIPWMVGKKHTQKSNEKNRLSHLCKYDGNKNSQYGTRWITNDEERKKIGSNDSIPFGWRYGWKLKI